jgi:four helix bundle protein
MRQHYEIHDRIFQFVVRGLKVPRYLPKTLESKVVIDQFLRSLTSVGANDNEADGATSKKDFIHCYAIVRKELKETYYWIRIISEIYPNLESRLKLLLNENEELIKIVSTIISKSAHPIKMIGIYLLFAIGSIGTYL